MKSKPAVPIAVIGMACRFPGSINDIASFWQAIETKRDCIGPIPANRWASTLLDEFGLTAETEFAKVGGFIDSIFSFDAELFGIAAREAAEIDPQQRILLELAWRCMEDAALAPRILEQRAVGVYVGVINHDYERLILANRNDINAYSGLGRSTSIAANRISYSFNLTGPSIAIDTACSSSLTAIDAACKALAKGDTDLAFAGGANAILAPESYVEFSKAAMLSKFGRCQAFDANADGFVRAEGGGMVLLKRLADALVDRDRIYATVLATCINQDGGTVGIMAPKRDAQQAMMHETLSSCGLSRNDIGFVEAHGTGTQIGDTTEAASLGAVYGHPDLYVGSVKSNIGHTESAAGIAGFIKAVLAVYFGKIPPNLHYSTPNPKIDFDALNLQVPTETIPWISPAGSPRIAAVNSFGFGGANAHAIIGEVTELPARSGTTAKSDLLIPVTARTKESLARSLQNVENVITNNATPWADLAYAGSRLPYHLYRGAVQAFPNAKIPIHRISAANDQDSLLADATEADLVAFVFSGIGKQWNGQGSQLYAAHPVFKDTVDRCDALFDPELKIRRTFEKKTAIADGALVKAHAVHFTLQLALSELWQSWGVRPAAVIGHSMGEIAAACSAGFVSLPTAVSLVMDRAVRIEPYCGEGQMLAVSLSPDKVRKVIDANHLNLVIAAINSPHSVTLAGPTDEIHFLSGALDQENKFNRVLEVPVPFHSPLIADAKAPLTDLPNADQQQQCQTTWFSSVTGAKILHEYKDQNFWWDNFLAPVKFSTALNAAIASGNRLFIEIGPHPSLNYNMHECFGELDMTGACAGFFSIHSDRTEDQTLKSTAGKLFTRGVDLDFDRINHTGIACQFPPVELVRNEYRKRATQPVEHSPHAPKASVPMIDDRRSVGENSWDIKLFPDKWHWLRDHRFRRTMVFPAAGYIEIALEAASLCFETSSTWLGSVSFTNLFEIPATGKPEINLLSQIANSAGSFQINSKATAFADSVTHCRGQLAPGLDARPVLPADDLYDQFDTSISPKVIYDQFDHWNIEGTSSCWRLREVRMNDQSELLATIDANTLDDQITDNWLLDPALLDLCFRCVVGIAKPSDPIVPYEIESLQYWQDKSETVYCHIRSGHTETRTQVFDLDIANSAGEVIARISKLRLRKLTNSMFTNLEASGPAFALKRLWKISQPETVVESRFDCEASSIRNHLLRYSSELASTQHRWRHYEHVDAALTKITLAYIGQALRQAGVPMSPSDTSFGEIQSQCMIENNQTALFQALLDLLSTYGHLEVIQQDHRSICATRVRWLKPLDTEPAESINAFLAMPEAGEYITELRLIMRCGASLLSVLTGKTPGLDVLFPDGETDLLQQFYSSAPTCRIYNQMLYRSVELLLDSWALARPCRILEVGAGTGALLSHLQPILENRAVDYTFTDVSSLFVRRAKTRFGHLEFVRFEELDLNAHLQAQGFNRECYDVVLASDALHLTHNPAQTLQNLVNLLQPGGHLTFIELTDEPNWARLVFGMLRDWWPQHHCDRSTVSPCLSHQQWTQWIDECGCNLLADLTDREDDATGIHTVFVTQKAPRDSRVELPLLASDRKRVIFCSSDQFSSKFVGHFETVATLAIVAGTQYHPGEDTFIIDPNEPQHYVQLIASLKEIDALSADIIFLWNFAEAPPNATSIEDKLRDSPALALTWLIQAFDQHGLTSGSGSLTLVSCNAQPLTNELSVSNCLEAGLWGVGRTLRNEYSGLDVRLIDIDASADVHGHGLYQFLLSGANLNEVCLRGSDFYIPIYENLDTECLHTQMPQHRVLATRMPGNIDSLAYDVRSLSTPGDTEVVIEVAAAALNFRDIMVALDALPTESIQSGYMQESLGIECVGTVVHAGNRVTDLTPGDLVVALARNSLATLTIADQAFVYRLPKECLAAPYCALPTAYVTALCCLQDNIKLKATDQVLIHCGSGGVGLALISLAMESGCKVFATAGTPEKARFLKCYGVEQVSDSRSTLFVDDVENWTNGKGVDVVVNMLSGELAAVNKKILKADGTLIELGKYADREKVHDEILLAKPKSNIITVDIDSMWRTEPDIIAGLFNKAMDLARNNELLLLPYQTFMASNAPEAFRHMAGAGHIGKVVLAFDQHLAKSHQLRESFAVQSDATYIVTGGTRGFGLATALWLAEQGAGHVVVIGRTPSRSKLRADVSQAAAHFGCQIHVLAADICDFESFQLALEATCRTLPPVRGVFHCAMEIEDSTIVNMDQDKFLKSSRSKVLGAWHLHQATQHFDLDCFMLFSSVTSILAPAGQAAYSAANAIIDAFASYLRQSGVRAVTINWGAVSDYGHVADHPGVSTAVGEQFGIRALPAKEMLVMLNGILNAPDISEIIVAGGNSAAIRQPVSVDHDSINQQSPTQSRPSDDYSEKSHYRPQTVFDTVSQVLSVSRGEIDPDEPIINLGIDSLLAVELSHLLRANCGLEISATALMDHITINELIGIGHKHN